MKLLNIPGTFRGDVMDVAVSRTDKGNVQVAIKIAVKEAFMVHPAMPDAGKAWYDVSGDEFEITGYTHLMKKGDTGDALVVNEGAVKSLRNAFRWWKYPDFANLQAPPGDASIQFDAEEETYNGKTKVKVKWIRHWGDTPAGGALKKATETELSSLNSAMTSRLAALGAKTAPPPLP